MRKKIVIRPLIREKFQEFLQGQRILFFSAPCGFGKTTVAEALLSGRSVLRRSGEEENLIPEEGDWNILLVDDFQRMPEENVLALCQYIRSTPDRRFVFLSRGQVLRTGSTDEIREETGKSLDELFREVFRCSENY